MAILVSIIIPVFNRSFLVCKTLDSVFAQTYRPIELIIVDDGSTDDTAEKVKGWQETHHNSVFQVSLLTQLNLGAAAARNHGLASARGEFVAFLDSDDLYHHQFVDKMTNILLKHQKYDLVVCNTVPFEKEDSIQEIADISNNIEINDDQFLFLKEYWSTPNVLYRKSILLKAGGWNEKLIYGWQDRELCLRLLLLEVVPVRYLAQLFYYRVSDHKRLSDVARGKNKNFYFSVSKAFLGLAIIAMQRQKTWKNLLPLFTRSIWFWLRGTQSPKS